jgi:hypothetical protein
LSVELGVLLSLPGGPLSLALVGCLLLLGFYLLLLELPHLAPGTPIALGRPLSQRLYMLLPFSVGRTLVSGAWLDQRPAISARAAVHSRPAIQRRCLHRKTVGPPSSYHLSGVADSKLPPGNILGHCLHPQRFRKLGAGHYSR